MKKLPAFTLMEVTIAMLLTSIAIAITYTAYRIVSRSYVDYAKRQEVMATFLTADKLLRQDFLQARRIVKSSEGVMEIETPEGQVRYQFKENYLLRDQFSLRVDTFKISIKSLDFSFENNPVEDGTLVDQLHFETLLEAAPLTLNYKKIYSAQDLFN